MNTCPHCGEDLPPRHVGRGKQKTFCSDNCRVKFAYRQRNPKKATNADRRGPPPGLKLRPVDRAWLAAFWDGEGYIGILRRRRRSGERFYYFPLVQAFNTNHALLSHVVGLIGAADIYTFERPNSQRHHKRIGRCAVRRHTMTLFLRAIYPYLVAKKRQAEIVMEFCGISDRCYVREYPEETYEKMWREMKALNQRGA